jgi:acetyltransferase-like isoleucine patch superfamily enzyme
MDTLIAAYVYCTAGGHEYLETEKPVSRLNATSKGIKIGNGCWIGAKALILDGIEIGENSIIGAAAVVIEDVPPYTIAAGIPAKVIKSRKNH